MVFHQNNGPNCMYLRAFRFVANKKTVSFSWNHENDIAIVTQNVTQNVAQQNDDVPRRQKVEEVISANSIISTDALATMFGVTKRTILRDLKDLGYVWEGAAKNGRWVKKNKE